MDRSTALPSRLVIPAPPELRRGDIVTWFDVDLVTDRRVLPKPGRSGNRAIFSTSQTEWLDQATLRTIIQDEVTTVEIALSASRQGGDDLHFAATINGQAVPLTGTIGDRDLRMGATNDLTLNEDDRTLMERWGSLSDSIVSLAYATRNSWACSSCLLLGAGLTVGVGCCAGGGLPCCVGVLTSGGTFVENCQGACADAPPIVAMAEVSFIEA